MLGARPPEEVRRRIAEAALLVAPCAVAGDGDRDGLPTVLIEAMALGTPVVSTPVTGIPELVRAGETGMSVPADDAAALARACAYLLGEPREVERLQVAARVHVERHFDARWTSAQLRSCFRVGGPRIVFRIHNRRGVGHWMRSHNIAREILALEPESEIVFLARGGAPFEPGDPRIRHVVAESGARPSLRELDRLGFAPDVVVDDTILPDERPEPGVRHVFVLRKRRREGLDSLVADGALDAVDRIIVPHGEDELGDCLPASLRRRLDFVGPIARAATAAGRARVRRAYGVGPGTRLLVSTPGGGGFREDVRRLVGIAGRVHDRLVGDDWRHVLVLGPNAVDEEAPRDERMIVVRSEPELPALLAEACCVISAAGYNTVQEIRLAGRPAVLLPGDRKYDDQTERAEAFARAGHGWCVDPTDAEAAATRIVACLEDAIGLARAEASLARSPLVVGNRAAAEVVLASGRDSRRVASSGAGATGDA
ncbi:MAG: glycosyltransferase [Myxococcota bacterium]